MFKKILIPLMALACLTAQASAAPDQTADKPIKWKAQTLWNAGDIPQKTFEDLCENIRVMSGGRLLIEAYPSGAIAPPNAALDALRKGALQVIHVQPGSGAAKNPALAAISDLVFAYRSPIELDAWLFQRGGMEMFRKIYAPLGAYPVGVMYWGPESWPSRKPLRKIEDFKNLKIHLPQGMQAETLSRVGAAVVQLPDKEIFPALDKGVIEACDWSSIGLNDSLGLMDLNGVDYANHPGFHSMPIGDFTVNLDEWNKLSPDLKAIVETAVRRWMVDSWETLFAADVAFLKKAREPGFKVEITSFPEEEMAKLTAQAQEVWAEWKNKNADCKEVIESQEAWLRDIGRIK